jgi:hypothetical protein
MRIVLVSVVGLAVLSYAASSEAAPAAAMPKLRTGERKLVDHPASIAAEMVAHFLDAREELIEAHVKVPEGRPSPSLVTATSAGGGAVFAFADGNDLWLRRPAADAMKAIAGDVYVSGSGIDPSDHYHFTVAPASQSTPAASVRSAFGKAAANLFDRRSSGAFDNFASNRVRAQYGLKADPARTPRTRWESDDIGRLMDTTTAMTSIQETLQIDRALWLRTLKEKPTVSLASLKPPPLAQHPFDAMLRALKRPVPEEKLANAAPADFYYARLNDLSVFFRIVDQLDAWATPAVTALEGGGDDHAIAERTLTQLGLERSQLARTLGTAVVADLAIVGSDPYVREGSDVTILFRVKQKALFDGALANALQHHNEAHPADGASTVDAGGVLIRISRSSDGAVRQHRASVGDLEIVSNSLAATRHVLEAIAGRAPRLSDEPDWKYMMARTSDVPADGLVYLGDRFIGEVIGPRQKILEARRQLALSELLVPGYAALLYGWFEGHAPASAAVLIDRGWLNPDELLHVADGAPIAFKPGRSARSAWGTSSAMTPLYDLPAPKLVTPAEQSAYEWFATSYQRNWRQYMDPVAIRLAITPDGPNALKLTADVRILPLVDDSEYNRISRMVGRAKIVTPALGSGLRWSMGIGADASLRRDLTQLSRNSPLGERIALDWLGDWLLVGVEDRTETVRSWFALDTNAVPQAPANENDRENDRRNMYATVLQTPAYLAFGVDNVIGAALFLTVAKKLIGDASPGLVTWNEGPAYKGQRTVHIAVAAEKLGSDTPGGDVWYALSNDALIFALSEPVLHHLLDERRGGKGTRAAAKISNETQFVLEWSSVGPLRQLLGWLLEKTAVDSINRSRNRAENFLRGAPGADLHALALAYEGAEPLPPDGGHYTLAADGVRDPARGSAVRERWPALPVAGSPVERLMTAVSRFRGEIAIDQEQHVEGQAAMQSLHARVTLGLKP